MPRCIKGLCLALFALSFTMPQTAAQEPPKDASSPENAERLRAQRKRLGDVAPRQEMAEGVPMLKNLPIVGELFKKKRQDGGLTISPLRMKDGTRRDTEPKDASFLQRRQCQEILSRFSGIDSVEVVEVKKTTIGRQGAETKSKSEITMAGEEEAKHQARQLLDRWARLDHKLVHLEFRLIERKSKAGTAPQPHTFRSISSAAFDQILKDCQEDAKATITAMPKLTVVQGQRATLSILNEVAYVKDFDVEVAQNSYIAEPIIDVIHEGLFIATTPVIDVDGKGIMLAIDAQISSIQRPIPEISTQAFPGSRSPVTIQLPQVYFNSKQTDSLHLTGGRLAFRAAGLKAFKGEHGEETVHYELLGRATILK